ncbi:LmbU family transcriptional regulator [Actinoplanes sp. NPDC051470]|uniref:LmbU family transcriptional regulator n=1 Tax=unclassified Actinoplanes TaxID=2626549 RepID=UPI00344AA170
MPIKATSVRTAAPPSTRSSPGRDAMRAVSAPAPDPSTVLITRVGLRLPPDLTYEGWERAGQRLADVYDSSAWCLGDWIVYGESQYADRYRRAVDAAGLEYQTIRNYAWVARRFDLGRRRSALSFQHHAEVARFSDTEQDVWLAQAEERRWSRNELRRQIKLARTGGVPIPPKVPLPRIEAEQARLARWQAAAERVHGSLQSWIIESLDAAAAMTLGEGSDDEEGSRVP